MTKIVNISFSEPFKLICSFKNGEQRLLDLKKALNTKNKYVDKILNAETFNQAKIGVLGDIYWDNAAKMKDLNKNSIPCEYDISSEFAYHNSTLIK